MSTETSTYVIHSDDEPKRLDRQAAIYGADDDLRYASLGPNSKVLDAGCGSGSAARLFARAHPTATIIGVDRNAQYLDYAAREAVKEGASNVSFQVGDVLGLPFADATFDIVWSKHLLQWVRERADALKEFVRVTKPGGRVVACNFDGFCSELFPVKLDVQQDIARWFAAAQQEFGFENYMGRKLPTLFKEAGLVDIKVNSIPDRAFFGFGGDSERRWNWEVQWNSALPFSSKVFGSLEAAKAATDRILEYLNDPEIFNCTTLYYVEGRVPHNSDRSGLTSHSTSDALKKAA